MPWADANGLLPGRGMPGVADGAPDAGLSAEGADGAEAGADGAALGTEVGAEVEAGVSAVAAEALGASAFGSTFAAGLGSSFGLAFGNASRSFLATGGVIVDEPLLTYSPSCSSFAKASLVSIPSSLAMS